MTFGVDQKDQIEFIMHYRFGKFAKRTKRSDLIVFRWKVEMWCGLKKSGWVTSHIFSKWQFASVWALCLTDTRSALLPIFYTKVLIKPNNILFIVLSKPHWFLLKKWALDNKKTIWFQNIEIPLDCVVEGNTIFVVGAVASCSLLLLDFQHTQRN